MNWLFILLSIGFVIILFAGVLIYFGSKKLDVSEYEINCEKIPTEFDGFIIAQISDFHNTRSSVIPQKLIHKLNQMNPDIIVITGDFIDSYRTDFKIAFAFLKEIISIAPIYYVTGNHEERIYNYQRFAKVMSKLGVKILDNSKVTLHRNGKEIDLIGVRDILSYSTTDKEVCKGLLEHNLDEISDDSGNYKILLSHRPDLFDAYAKCDIDLVLCGHAHGGQFRIPHFGGLFSPSQGLFPKYTSGLHIKENTKMIVSRGIGNSSFPFRINNNPELVTVILKLNNKTDSL